LLRPVSIRYVETGLSSFSGTVREDRKRVNPFCEIFSEVR